jgi:hypothetical protein
MSLREANRIKYAKIDQAATTDIVSAPSGSTVGQKIRVISYVLVSAGTATVVVKWNSGTTPTNLTGSMTLTGATTGVPVVLALAGSPDAPLLECGVNEKLTLTQAGAVQISGHVAYMIVPATP